jgi:hypothetical protein
MAQLISFKKANTGEVILSVLFVIYLIMGYNTPEPLASFIDTLFGKIILFLVVVYMFLNCNSIVAILALLVIFDLIRRSSSSQMSIATKYQPSEENKSAQFSAFNQFPYTLEQEVIKKMVPTMTPGSSLSKPSYKPVLENLYDASSVNAN